MKDNQIKDSGERTEFASGAVRDMHEGKGDMASVPWEAILRLSKHYENGAKKYSRWNYRKGIPISSYIDSCCRHIAKYQCGCDDEDHLAAAAFNILGAMLMENTMPEMQDLPLRAGKKTFDYFEEEKNMTYKEMLDVVKSGAESKSAGITNKVEFTVKPDTKNPGGITIGWVTECGGNKYGDYIRETRAADLYKAGSLLAEQCLCLLEDLKEAKRCL